MGVLEQLWIAFVPVVIAFVVGRIWEKARVMRRYGYIRTFIGKADKVPIIVSNIEVSRFKFANESQETIRLQVPRNVLYMPMPEGRAVGELSGLLHRINRKVTVQLVSPGQHDPEAPTISIGGPSVNSFSARALSAEFPDFRIEYPATKRARYGGHAFETQRSTDDMLVRDYGFIFVTRTSKNAPCLIFCGIRAFGTAMAVELFRILPNNSEAARYIRRGEKSFIVAEGKIEGLEETAVRLGFCRKVVDEQRRIARVH